MKLPETNQARLEAADEALFVLATSSVTRYE